MKIVDSGASGYREILKYLKTIIDSKSKINFGAVPSSPNELRKKADLTVLTNFGYIKQMTNCIDSMKKMVNWVKTI